MASQQKEDGSRISPGIACTAAARKVGDRALAEQSGLSGERTKSVRALAEPSARAISAKQVTSSAVVESSRTDQQAASGTRAKARREQFGALRDPDCVLSCRYISRRLKAEEQ